MKYSRFIRFKVGLTDCFFVVEEKRRKKTGFHSGDGIGVAIGVVRSSAYDLVKIKNPRSRNQSHRSDGIGVGIIRTFQFSSDSSYDSIVYDLVKTKLSESEAKATGKNKPITMHARTLCDWFSSAASASDSDNQFSLDRFRQSRKRNQNTVLTRLLIPTLLITTPTTSLVKTSLKQDYSYQMAPNLKVHSGFYMT